MHVVRCFDDENVIHVDGSVDPLRDIEVISLELILADYAQVEKRLERVRKDVKGKKEGAAEEAAALEKLLPVLDAGTAARKADLTDDEWLAVKGLGLLSAKPVIYGANVADSDLAEGNEMVEQVRKHAAAEGASVVVVSAQVEAELVDLDDDERAAFLEELGVPKGETGLDKLIREAYDLLKLRTYFTSGETETKAWDDQGGDARAAGGRRHPHRLRARLHPRGDDRVRRPRGRGLGEGRQGGTANCARRARSTRLPRATSCSSASTSRSHTRSVVCLSCVVRGGLCAAPRRSTTGKCYTQALQPCASHRCFDRTGRACVCESVGL